MKTYCSFEEIRLALRSKKPCGQRQRQVRGQIRSQSNLGFQSATGRVRGGEPDRSCRLPSPPGGRTRPVASLLIRDQAKMPVRRNRQPPSQTLRRAKGCLCYGSALGAKRFPKKRAAESNRRW